MEINYGSENYWHLRVTKNVDDPSKLILFCKERTIKYLICRENQDGGCSRDHLHCQFTSIHKGTQDSACAVKKKVRKNLHEYCPDYHGQTDHVLKVHVRVGFNYTAKGLNPDWNKGAPIIVSTNFTLEEVKEFHRLYWESRVGALRVSDPNAIKVDLAQLLEQKAPKVRSITWTERIINELCDSYPNRVWDKNQETDVMFLTTYILRNMGARGRALDDFIFKKTFYSVYNGLATRRKTSHESTHDHDRHYGRLISTGW